MSEPAEVEMPVAVLIAALMRAADVRELRVFDEDMVRMPAGMAVLTYRDQMADMTVFRLAEHADVIDGEEVEAQRALEGR